MSNTLSKLTLQPYQLHDCLNQDLLLSMLSKCDSGQDIYLILDQDSNVLGSFTAQEMDMTRDEPLLLQCSIDLAVSIQSLCMTSEREDLEGMLSNLLSKY